MLENNPGHLKINALKFKGKSCEKTCTVVFTLSLTACLIFFPQALRAEKAARGCSENVVMKQDVYKGRDQLLLSVVMCLNLHIYR